MIKATNLVKRFGNFTALESLNTEIPAGSIYGLVGSNGSGKSTFLRLAAGIYQPDGGEIQINGEAVYENTAIKDKTFFVSDDFYFLAQCTMNDMARFYKSVYSRFSEERYKKLCDIFPLDPKKKISTFSKGMKRQATLLLGLSCQPDLMLLDEAFDGLDPVIRGACRRLLADDTASRNATILITSHNLRELEDLCDHVGLLHRGKILFERELDELKLGFCKIHAAFAGEMPENALEDIAIMQQSKTGSLINLIARGNSADLSQLLLSRGAIFAEGVPLTLEEVFIHEMEAVGYDYNNIIF